MIAKDAVASPARRARSDRADAGEDPLWTARPAARSERRTLSRGAIVTAALEIADEEGLAAVSMPRLARWLGAAPMSLYRHVPHKDALLDLMLDAAVGEPPDVTAASLRAGLTTWARANRTVFAAHPWTLPLVSGERRMGPAECAWAEAFLGVADDAGVPVARALTMLTTLNAYVRGASAPVTNRVPTADEVRRSGRADSFPLLLEVLPDGRGDSPEPGYDDADFEAGLAAVLDGLDAR